MIKRIWARLTGRRLVWLRDMDGDVTLAIADLDRWGNLTAERWWPFSVHRVKLLDDGTVDDMYVKHWRYVESDGR